MNRNLPPLPMWHARSFVRALGLVGAARTEFRLVGVEGILDRIFPTILLVAALLCLASAPAVAQGGAFCAMRPQALEALERRFGEVPVGMGMARRGIVELLLSPDASWSVLVTMPDGRSCVLATGSGWEATGPPPPEGDPA